MATLLDYFTTDFSACLSANHDFRLINADINIIVPTRTLHAFDPAAKFIAIFVKAQAANVPTCHSLVLNWRNILDYTKAQADFSSSLAGETPTFGSTLEFTRRVYLYVESSMAQRDKKGIEALGRSNYLSIRVRDMTWAANRSEAEKPLAFICHDSRDKDAYARPLALRLTSKGCPVWFDEFALRVGDSLRESIERGIRETRKCILVLTPHFLANPGWTKREFDSVFTRELLEEKNVILPVWIGVDKHLIYQYSPILADRLGVSWENGIDSVVHALIRAINIHDLQI